MKVKTFTVIFTEEFPHEMSDEEIRDTFVQALQNAYDGDDICIEGHFLLMDMEDGADEFWASWADKMREDHGAKESS